MIITITREQNTSRSYAYGRQYVWCYLYTFSEDARTARGHVYPAGAPVNYGRGLAACREMLHRNWPDAEIKQAWPAKATPTPTTDAVVKDTWLRASRADLAEAYGSDGLGPYAPASNPVWARIWGERS